MVSHVGGVLHARFFRPFELYFEFLKSDFTYMAPSIILQQEILTILHLPKTPAGIDTV